MLEVSNLFKSFGALRVIDDVSFTLKAGECLGVMGPNGAGKSTLFDLLTGVTRTDSGSVALQGNTLDGLPPERRVPLGISRAFQVPKPFASLSVKDHLVLAAQAGGGLNTRTAQERATEVLHQTGLTPLQNELGGGLRLLDRKRLELAKALATRPKVLLLDEISGGLTEHEVAALIELVDSLKGQDYAILWIEHIAHALNAVCDRIMMLHLGQKIIDDTPSAVSQDPRVRELYLGSATRA